MLSECCLNFLGPAELQDVQLTGLDLEQDHGLRRHHPLLRRRVRRAVYGERARPPLAEAGV